MDQPSWRTVQLKTDKVAAKPAALWTLVHEYVKGPGKLRIRATGTWQYSSSRQCSADGCRESGFSADAVTALAPLGALIGKIGGSPADKADQKTFTFVAGSYVVLIIDDKTEGALYLTMNDLASHFDEHAGELQVQIDEARSGSS